LHADAAVRALADAGLSLNDVDGLATTGDLASAGNIVGRVAERLNIRPRWADGTMVGGCSFLLHVRHAAAAIAAGAADVVLVTHGESGRSRVGSMPYSIHPSTPEGQFEAPYGALFPYSTFTIPAVRFLQLRGMGQRDLAEVVVAQREWAARNPRAFLQQQLTVDDVLAAKPIAYPFTRPMCCLVTDGGGALVLTSRERAKDLPSATRAVYLQGSGEALESAMISQMDDVDTSAAFRQSSADAFSSSDLTPNDIQHLMAYDAFAHIPLFMLEDLGFVGKGESGSFIRDGHTREGGRLPMNTNGGGLSYTHTGMYGMFAIQESVRQLRGEAAAQVPNLSLSMVHGVGMYFAASASLILSNADYQSSGAK